MSSVVPGVLTITSNAFPPDQQTAYMVEGDQGDPGGRDRGSSTVEPMSSDCNDGEVMMSTNAAAILSVSCNDDPANSTDAEYIPDSSSHDAVDSSSSASVDDISDDEFLEIAGQLPVDSNEQSLKPSVSTVGKHCVSECSSKDEKEQAAILSVSCNDDPANSTDEEYIPDSSCDDADDSGTSASVDNISDDELTEIAGQLPVDSNEQSLKPSGSTVGKHCVSECSSKDEKQQAAEGDSVLQHSLEQQDSEQQMTVDDSAENNISVTTSNNENGRKYDKKAFCYFCGLRQSKLARHLRLKHRHEDEVDELVRETNKDSRNTMLLKLRNLGNHYHNVSVIKHKEGELIVVHRPADDETDYQKYIPCRYCYGYFSKASIWKHSCPLAPKTPSGTAIPRIRKGGKEMLQSFDGHSVGFTGLLNGMRQDEDGSLAVKDALILQYGRSLCNKFGGDAEQFNYIRCKMRQSAKLLRRLRRMDSQSSSSLSDYIQPTKFKLVVQAAKECAGFCETEYQTPSSALKFGGMLKRLAEHKQVDALKRGDTSTADESSQFIKLCEMSWANEVSSVAVRNLADRKRNAAQFMPLTEDVVKLNSFLVSEAGVLVETVDSCESFLKLTQVVLAKTILFNRKRQGEVGKIKLHDFSCKRKADNSDVCVGLSDFEKGLLKIFTRMEIKGKRGRTVPVLLTDEMINWIDNLVSVRSHYIPECNPYLFSTVGDYSHFRGSDVLRKFAMESGAKKPQLLTSTRLRKHVACLAQVVSLRENELDSLATFLGHDLRVHSQYYRLPLDVVQTAKISKLFMAAENGTLTQFAGKTLDDITIADNEEVDSDSDTDTQTDVDELPSTVAASCSQDVDSSSYADDSNVTDGPNSLPQKRRVKKTRNSVVKKPWSSEEKEAVKNHFASNIVNRKLPGKAEIVTFLSEYKIDRPWLNVKDHIRNTYFT